MPAEISSHTPPPDADFPYRMHLRIEPDGSGLLVVNGSTVVHLNQTAAEYAYHFILNTDAEAMSRQVAGRYGISSEQAR